MADQLDVDTAKGFVTIYKGDVKSNNMEFYSKSRVEFIIVKVLETLNPKIKEAYLIGRKEQQDHDMEQIKKIMEKAVEDAKSKVSP